MGGKTGLWGLLAAACAITGLVVVAAAVLGPRHDTARVSAYGMRPPEQSLAAPQSTLATPELSPAPRTARAVTLHERPPKPVVVPAPTLDFQVSSFNVLGSSHTRSGGTHARFGSGPERARRAASIVLGHGVDVVGFQEMQADQLSAFMGATGGRYTAYPGFKLGPLNTENSIAWRTDDWQLVQAQTFSIPYFRGHLRQMPAVRLKNLNTGLEAWFVNVHNPADTPQWGNNQRWRDAAMGEEARLVTQLEAGGLPVFLTGDMNERAQVFCAITGGTDLQAAMGGSDTGGCVPPPHIPYVDWIFGSPQVSFSNYIQDDSSFVRGTSDHPIVVSTATLKGTPTTVTPAPTPGR